MRRREEDSCFVKRAWRVATPYVQVIGWIIVAVPVLLSFGNLVNSARAFDERLTAVETSVQKLAAVDQKLDLVINLVRSK